MQIYNDDALQKNYHSNDHQVSDSVLRVRSPIPHTRMCLITTMRIHCVISRDSVTIPCADSPARRPISVELTLIKHTRKLKLTCDGIAMHSDLERHEQQQSSNRKCPQRLYTGPRRALIM